jgi:hypothetical protein
MSDEAPKMLTMFPKRTSFQMRMEFLCKINTATNKSHDNYLIINTTYVNKFISFMFKKEELKQVKQSRQKHWLGVNLV